MSKTRSKLSRGIEERSNLRIQLGQEQAEAEKLENELEKFKELHREQALRTSNLISNEIELRMLMEFQRENFGERSVKEYDYGVLQGLNIAIGIILKEPVDTIYRPSFWQRIAKKFHFGNESFSKDIVSKLETEYKIEN